LSLAGDAAYEPLVHPGQRGAASRVGPPFGQRDQARLKQLEVAEIGFLGDLVHISLGREAGTDIEELALRR
jgi:hypothetical protein